MHVDESENPAPSPVSFRVGLAICVLFAIVAVLVRGVRWDETFEHAQIIAGEVTYPAGHPLSIYVHNAFSLQTYLSAFILELGGSPWLLCAFRNLLFLLATMLPVYALTAHLARSVLAGLVATLLLLQGVLLAFDGSYPSMIWPEFYSNGHIGGGLALLGLACFVARADETAWYLLGLLPALHLGQWPPLLGTLLLYGGYLVYLRMSGRHRYFAHAPRLRTLLAMAAAGGTCAFLFWLIQRLYVQPFPSDGPFAVSGDVAAVWQGYTAHHDPHRQFPPGNGHILLAGTLLLCLLGALYGRLPAFRRACLWLGVYVGFIAVAVWGAMAVHAVMGTEIPFFLIAWMPYRLINQLPPVLMALMTALVLLRWPVRGWWIVGGALGAALTLPLWDRVFNPVFFQRYLADGAWIAFGLFGAALLAGAPERRHDRTRVILLAIAAILPLAVYHRFGATCVVLGLFIAYLTMRGATRQPIFLHPILLLPLAILLAGTYATLQHQHRHYKQLPVTPFEQQLRTQLEGQENAMLLASPDAIRLQATTCMPVLADAATPSLISYMPTLGPAIDSMYRDLYGYGFAIDGAGVGLPWPTLWMGRTRADWNRLASTYGFTHVVTPADWDIPLNRVFAAGDYALYAVAE